VFLNYNYLGLRFDFQQFLIENEFYDIDHILENLRDFQNLEQEHGIVMVKLNKFEEGVNLIFKNDFYNNNFRLLKCIIKKYANNNEFILIIIKRILENDKIDLDKLNEILSLLKDQLDLILEIFSLDVFNKIKIDKLFPFFIQIFGQTYSKSKTYKIENSLSEGKIMNIYEMKIGIEKQFFIVEESTCCEFCKKGFVNNDIVNIYPNLLFHSSCYQKELNMNMS